MLIKIKFLKSPCLNSKENYKFYYRIGFLDLKTLSTVKSKSEVARLKTEIVNGHFKQWQFTA
jgi:hypothetical protein